MNHEKEKINLLRAHQSLKSVFKISKSTLFVDGRVKPDITPPSMAQASEKMINVAKDLSFNQIT